MGDPTSAILAEVYIKFVEQKQLYPILSKYQITGYLRYTDGILIIYEAERI